jgi:hypothetical protein
MDGVAVEVSVTTAESSTEVGESGKVLCGLHQEGIWKTVPCFSFSKLDKPAAGFEGEAGKKWFAAERMTDSMRRLSAIQRASGL